MPVGAGVPQSHNLREPLRGCLVVESRYGEVIEENAHDLIPMRRFRESPKLATRLALPRMGPGARGGRATAFVPRERVAGGTALRPRGEKPSPAQELPLPSRSNG